MILFGEWDNEKDLNGPKIFSESWQVSRKGNKQQGYKQSREHIRLIEEKGYQLRTFPMIYSNENEEDGTGPAKIGKIVPILTTKHLKKVGADWYAVDSNAYDYNLPEEIKKADLYKEGALKNIYINAYERSSKAREKCIEQHGYLCAICFFNFEKIYGDIGKNYIHVHHIVPLAECGGEYKPNPVTDLIPVCPNCHAMLHTSSPPISIEELRKTMVHESNR